MAKVAKKKKAKAKKAKKTKAAVKRVSRKSAGASKTKKVKKARKPRETAPKTPPVADSPADRLIPPANGVTIRIYRIGHGDCHLLAFPSETPDKPVYVLIDCGYKPGSPGKLKRPTSAKEITANIRAATGGHIDVAVISHEHQDHVNGITANNFKDVTIGEAWFAWTEDPKDDYARKLRRQFDDKLVGLIAARDRLGADAARKVDEYLAFELGGEDERFNARAATQMLGAAAGGGGSMNKSSMKVFKDLARNGQRFFRPHEKIHEIEGTRVRVFALGPPRDPDDPSLLIKSLDPEGDEGFHRLALSAASPGNYFAAAAANKSTAPFAPRYCVPIEGALDDDDFGPFFRGSYGGKKVKASYPEGSPRWTDEVHGNPDWRRIDDDWLFSAEQLALDMNNSTNNSSLVLAFELGKGGKVLLFPADAQRGNWISWSMGAFKDGKEKVTAKDLLGRTVFYKVGHHGSHNATLHGQIKDTYPNLDWMAAGDHAREFTAMITAVRAWAETQKGWDHPLKSIKEALLKKASGRVFQTDTEFEDMEMPDDGSDIDWKAFRARTKPDRLYFDYTISF